MLPTTGHFKNIECPFHESTCDRPYCHFRHRKKISNEAPISVPEVDPIPSTSSEIPTYNPTPKSQLASTRNMHIPIPYVPDLAVLPREGPFRYNANKPIYKPTPLSVLSSKDVEDTNEVPKYNPSEDISDIEINFEDLTNEFDMIDELIGEGNAEIENALVQETPVEISHTSVDVKDNKNKQGELKSNKDTNQKSNCDIKDKHARSKSKDKSDASKSKTKDKHESHSKSKSKTDSKSRKSRNSESDSDLKSKSKKHSESVNHKKSSIRTKSKPVSDSEVSKRKKHSDSESEPESKSKKLKKKKTLKDSESEAELKQKSRRNKDESASDCEKKRKTKAKIESKHRHKHKNKSASDDSEVETLKTRKNSTSESDSTHKKSKSKDKNKKSHLEKHKSKMKTSTSKSSTTESKHKSSSKSKSDSNHKDRSKHKTEKDVNKSKSKSSKTHKKDEQTQKPSISNLKIEIKTIETIQNDDNSDYYSDNLSELSDSETMEECYKIFTEYKPTEPQIFFEQPESSTIKDANAPNLPTKKRVAHDNATQAKLVYSKPKALPTAAQIMMNRFKTICSTNPKQQIDEQSDIIAEVNKLVSSQPPVREREIKNPPHIDKKPPNVEKKVPRIEKKSLIDDIINGRSVIPPKRRIAPVLNAGLIQKAKAHIDEIKARNLSASKTTVQTVLKGVKRVAHLPERTTLEIPDVLEIERSKLPVNVRSRFLTMMVEECLKLYYSKDEAHQRAVNEEFKCYERCAVLVTYRNSAMLAINRLRKEHQEREAAGLDLILPGETPSSNKDAANPLRGRLFYNNIVGLLLSEEELILHGFPRESTTPGRAQIKPRKNQPHVVFSENDRVCARCSKHYQVDDNGFVLYEEECLYHPLKKRTFRGESIYLCCKSGDGSGCVTSNTHVCDCNSDDCDGYQATMSPVSDNDHRNYSVYALDCEMCYTTKGLELTRVTIVNEDCKTVYETLVKPMNTIIDYNTRFSGITQEQMERTATSILQVQANILHLCNAKTILIGHSLESDMKALKIIHNSVIDTSVLFPHKFGLPHKRALRDLAREYLKKIIQNDVSGHDSAEDALTCMELLQWKIKEDHGIKI